MVLNLLLSADKESLPKIFLLIWSLGVVFFIGMLSVLGSLAFLSGSLGFVMFAVFGIFASPLIFLFYCISRVLVDKNLVILEDYTSKILIYFVVPLIIFMIGTAARYTQGVFASIMPILVMLVVLAVFEAVYRLIRPLIFKFVSKS